MTASLAGSNSQGTTLTGGIRLTHLTPQFDDTLTLKLSKLKTPSPLSGESLPWEDNPYLPPVITIGSLSMEGNLNIQPDGLALRLKFSAASIDSNYNGSGKYTDEVMRVIRELLDRIQSVDLELSLKERVSNLTMNINSNIGAQIRTSIENLLTSGLKEFNKELQRKVNERKNQTEKELTKFQNEDCRKLLIAEANRIESELTRVEGFIDSKITGLRDAIDSGADTVRDAVDAGADTARDAVDNGADAVRDIFR